MRALLIIDLQNDLLPGGALAVKDSEMIVPIINDLQKEFNLIVATQNWHPAHHQSFASSHTGKEAGDVIYFHGYPQALWPDHCIQCSHGAELSRLLDQKQIAAILRKGMNIATDSYSAFYDNTHCNCTGMAGYLKEKMVDEIYIAGLAGDYGVYYTAMDSLRLNFKTFLIEDATRPLNRHGFQEALEVFVAQGGAVVQSCQIINKEVETA